MKTNNPPKIALVGATGAVGEVFLEILAKRFGPKANVQALASADSVGREVSFGRRSLVVDDVARYDFSGCDFALFSAGSSVSLAHAPRAARSGAVVIDNTSAFRQDPEVPLVIPEINGAVLDGFSGGMIANPNCSTIQMLVALNPIYQAYGIRSIVVSTYQSVSGAGKAAMEELGKQTLARFNFKEPECHVFEQPIGFNVLPKIGGIETNGFSEEELKMHHETRRIWDDQAIVVNATAVRVPVFVGHAESIFIETVRPIDEQHVVAMMREAPGVAVTKNDEVATPLGHAEHQDLVWVSRIRSAMGGQNGLMMWVVADNLRKGAALNATQIMDYLISST